MAHDILRIRHFLARLRRRTALLTLAELLLLCGTLASTLVLLAAALGGLELTHPFLPPVFWTLLVGLPATWIWRVLWPRYRPMRGPRTAARYVDSRVPELRNATLSALELAPGGAHLEGFSSDLIEAAIHDAAERLTLLTPSVLLPGRVLKPWGLAFVAACGAVLTVAAWMPERFQHNLQAFFAPPLPSVLPALAPKSPSADGPALGDITVTLVYPAYLNRQTEVLENSNGEILAPIGSQVTISARSAVKPKTATLTVQGGTPVAATIAEDGRFSAGFIVDKKSTYRFTLDPGGGAAPVVSRAYPIEVELDASPTIEVAGLSPVNEVSPNQPVNFSFQAQDDHGISRVDLVVEGPKGPVRKTLRELPSGQDREEGDVVWYPSEWEIPQGGSVDLWLEARDDDTVSGPKVGKSSRYKMILSSPERRREQVLEGKEQLKEAMIAVLGDGLVQHAEPMTDKNAGTYAQELQQLSQGMTKVMTAFTALRQMMAEDTQEERVVYKATLALEQQLTGVWEPLEQGLKALTGGAEASAKISALQLKDRRAGFIEGFERGILSMETFANMQRMESILTSGEAMRKAGEDLKNLLEDLKKSGKTPDTKQLLEKLDAIQQKMGQLAQQLTKLDRSSSEWFQNPSGDAQKVKDALDEVRELLKQGRNEEAMKKLEEYLRATDALMNTLKDMQREEFGDDRDQMAKDMEGAINGLKDLENQQRKLLDDTQAVRDSLMKKAGLSPDRIEQVTKEALKKLEAMKSELSKTEAALEQAGAPPDQESQRHVRELKDRMQTLEAALKAGDVARSLRESWDSVQSFRLQEIDLHRMENLGRADTREAMAHNQAGRKNAEALTHDLEDLANKMDEVQNQAAAQGQGLASRQASLKQKGQELGRRLEDYAKDSPVIPGSWGERLQKAAKSMEGAGNKLGSGELPGGAADEQVALQQLGELRKEMETTQKEMAQRARGTGTGSMSIASGRGAGSPGSTENWGGNGSRNGKVDISRDFQAPEKYRREIMEGMKGEAPERYKRLNREYYEKLVR